MPGVELLFVDDDGREAWTSVSFTPMKDAAGEVVGAIAVVQDIEERKKAETTQQLLVDELNHRVKNTLANVQAITHLMLQRTKDPHEFATGFSDRIQSLSRVHSMLSAATWRGVDLLDLVRDQLLTGAVDETRITASGPPVHLEAQLALHVALTLHELGTNAIKHGALSTAIGVVRIRWSVPDAMLRLRWEERGVPVVDAPARRGFGRTLIEQSAKGEGGAAFMSIEGQGVVWNIALPLRERQTMHPASRTPRRCRARTSQLQRESDAEIDGKASVGRGARGARCVGHRRRARRRWRRSSGIGGTAIDALNIINNTALDAALLDANLQGDPVDEIASALAARNVPFLFVRKAYRRSSAGAPCFPSPSVKTSWLRLWRCSCDHRLRLAAKRAITARTGRACHESVQSRISAIIGPQLTAALQT